MAFSSSSALDPSSSIPSFGYSSKYQVFLSFRGVDTRQGFTWNLYNSLIEAGIQTFMDEKDIEAGEKIDEKLLNAIADSRYCVVILSIRYADSMACLMELAAMFRLNKKIIPVFLYIDPSDVQNQSGPFEIAFSNHQNCSNSSGDVEEWKQALTKVGQFKGFHLSIQSNKKEVEVIQEIVERVGGCRDNVILPVAEHPVGIDSRVEEVMELLSIKEGDVKMVGIYGMGGIGKTTLAKEIYNRLQGRFDKAIYIEGIKNGVKKDGLPKLQEEFISKAFKEGNKKIHNPSEGSAEIKRRLSCKSVLAVLDDVDDGDQLIALAGGCDWFGEGTRILFTTRDEQLLDAHRHVSEKYQVPEFDERESLHLFSRYAFNSDQPSEEFMEISKKIVKATGGLPLALEVLGASLYKKNDEEEWEEVETKLRDSKYSKIDKCLRISYDGLSLSEQEGFLDIACFFVGEEKDEVIDIWKGCDFGDPVSTVNSLLHKCLVKIDDYGKLGMHDLLRDMGRMIGSSSRLWDQKEVWEVLEDHKGTNEIKGIICKRHLKGEGESSDCEGYLEGEGESSDCEGYSEGEGEGESFDVHSLVPPEGYVEGEGESSDCEEYWEREGEGESVDVEAFANMSNLKLLVLKDINLKGDFSRMPRSLRSLKWSGCPMKTLPDNFNIQKLGCLKLCYSDIVQFWSDSCISKKKVFANLKVLHLRSCLALTKLPDFSHSLNLEKLRLESCRSLTVIPESIGKLTRLKSLMLDYCTSLSALPDSIGNLTRLRRLDLSYCESLSAFPSSLKRLTLLEDLQLRHCTSLSTLPDSIGKLTRLNRLDLYYCRSLSVLPSSIGRLTLLEELNLFCCISLSTLPDSIGNLTKLRRLDRSNCQSLSTLSYSIGRLTLLEELILEHCTCLSRLPDSIGNLTRLRELDLSYCTSLSALPFSIGRLTLLEELKLHECTSLSTLPDSIGSLTKLRRLDLSYCQSLSALPDSIGNLTLLEELILYKCTSLSTLPDSIGNLTQLRRLNLSYCRSLLALPDSIGNLTLLEELQLWLCTSLSTLPDSIGNLTGLRWLDLTNCKSLSAFPSSIERLTLLEVLDLSLCTSLSTLPDSIGDLTELRRLYLSKCESLSALPDSIGNLTLLEKLNLFRCTSLSTLPSSIGNMRSLTTLVLIESGIEELPDSLRLLESLEWLLIGKCRLRSCLPLSEMKFLKVLVIGGEDIDSEDEDENEICEISDGISDNDDGGRMEVYETLDGITHYSRHTQECRRIRYIKNWNYIFGGRLKGIVLELSIWAMSGRERKIILGVHPSRKRHEERKYWNGPWLKHIFPDDFTPLHDKEALDAYASSSPAPDISMERVLNFYRRMDTLRGEY